MDTLVLPRPTRHLSEHALHAVRILASTAWDAESKGRAASARDALFGVWMGEEGLRPSRGKGYHGSGECFM